MRTRFVYSVLFILSLLSVDAFAQGTITRPPAVPLMTTDPYFSVWSFANNPANDYTRQWTGNTMGICLMARIDGKSYRVVGNYDRSLPALDLKQTIVDPTQTTYVFDDAGIELKLIFTTPLLPDSLDLISEDASYITWKVRSVDNSEHHVYLYFDGGAQLCVNNPYENVVWGRLDLPGIDVMKMGSQRQAVLSEKGDEVKINWGYVYFSASQDQHPLSAIDPAYQTRGEFIQNGTLPTADDFSMPAQEYDGTPVAAYAFDLGEVGPQVKSRFLMVAYDEIYAVNYFHRNLTAYWKRNHVTISDMITERMNEYASLMNACDQFDQHLISAIAEKGGKDYASICALAYRQAFAATRLAADINGQPMLFTKENSSNGCISTVDVIYPSAPIFLYLNMNLVKAMLVPVFKYAELPRWKFQFAPHDLGTYPDANGQVYGGGETSVVDQMPVEESGNMIILTYAVCRSEHSAAFAEKYWSSLQKWADYLKKEGLDPANQLSTDDFTGHLAHNANLSVKAIVALGCFSKICELAGKPAEAKTFGTIAKEYAKKWAVMDLDGDHYKLAFNKPGTWSEKYNMVWDKIFGLDLFSPEVYKRELAFYLTKLNKYGLPLDSRAEFTKPEWMTWIATMYPGRKDFEIYMHKMAEFLNNTPERVPFTDLFDTQTAKQVLFQGRSVVGGVFMKMLSK